MAPSSPPVDGVQLALAVIPALFAALFATASALVASIPDSRKVALRNALTGTAKASLDRYLTAPTVVESRWLVIRVLGLAFSAILFDRSLPVTLGAGRYAIALGLVLLAYATPAYLGSLFARRGAEEMLPRVLLVLRPFEFLISPVAAPMGWLGHLAVPQVQHARPASVSLAESEVEILVNRGEEQGALGHDRAEMIRNVLDFGDLKAADVIIPRTQVTVLDVDMPAEEVLRLIAESSHSRYPVFRERIDNIVGILHVKDLIAYGASTDLKNLKISEVMRTPVVFVPETQTAQSLLVDMRSGRRHHMAIIIDEFGGMSGIVTLEDVIEEIVGDIRDEHDTDEPPIMDLGNGRLMVDAGLPISDLSRYLGIELPQDGDYNSLGGFLVERAGQVPGVGDVHSDFGLEFVVREGDERRLTKVEIIRRLETPAPGPESLVPAPSRRTVA